MLAKSVGLWCVPRFSDPETREVNAYGRVVGGMRDFSPGFMGEWWKRSILTSGGLYTYVNILKTGDGEDSVVKAPAGLPEDQIFSSSHMILPSFPGEFALATLEDEAPPCRTPFLYIHFQSCWMFLKVQTQSLCTGCFSNVGRFLFLTCSVKW